MKAKRQKSPRPFSDEVTWNLDCEIAKWIAPRLKRFIEVTDGFPNGLTFAKWKKVLGKMLRAFELLVTEGESGMLTPREYKEVCDGLDAFREYYRNLWW